MRSKESRIGADDAFLLVRRLSGLNYYPPDDEAVALLIKAMQNAPSVAAGEAFVEHWTLTLRNRECPKPGDICDHFKPKPSTGEYLGAPRNTGCPICGGSGWLIVERNGSSGAKKCQCLRAAVST